MFDSLGSPIAYPADVSKGISPGGGRVLYVNAEVGNDNHEGSDPQFPLATITAAREKCTDRKHDYIFVQDFAAGADTFPIVWNKSDVHLIGLGNGHVHHDHIQLDGGGSNVINLPATARGLEIAGFQMGSLGAYCIEILASVWNVHIHHCAFGTHVEADNGIRAPSGVAALEYSLVDHCLFDRYCARSTYIASATRSWFNHNLFRRMSICALNVSGGEFGGALGNVFYSPIADALAAGWAILLEVACSGGMIAGNYAMDAGSAAGNNPYRDMSGAVGVMTNGWVGNYHGPALSAGPDPA